MRNGGYKMILRMLKDARWCINFKGTNLKKGQLVKVLNEQLAENMINSRHAEKYVEKKEVVQEIKVPVKEIKENDARQCVNFPETNLKKEEVTDPIKKKPGPKKKVKK